MITSQTRECDRELGRGEGERREWMERLQCPSASNSPCQLRGHMPSHFTLRFAPDLPLSSQIQIGVSLPPNIISHSAIVSHRYIRGEGGVGVVGGVGTEFLGHSRSELRAKCGSCSNMFGIPPGVQIKGRNAFAPSKCSKITLATRRINVTLCQHVTFKFSSYCILML